MASSVLPLVLEGNNLGQRHRYLNSQVHQAATSQVHFQTIENLPEQTPVDRLFKIDLANKQKNIEYILKNLRDDDMLYVSRALKCKWLLERRDVISPEYLERELFPEMVIPAISKMKHWLYINLRDSERCQEFYQYYKTEQFNFAIKFLVHCDNSFVLAEFPNILLKITPHYLKVFGEKNPKLIQIYYNSLDHNNELTKRYLKEEQIYYNSIKGVLKLDPDLFLDITEKYHSLTTYNKLSPVATDYILRYHKCRFLAKPELYIVSLLHMSTAARRLSAEECQDVIIKLARADYLVWWFSYDNIEPLIKRISRDKRAEFKKRVFVEKNVGDRVKDWSYALPASPVVTNLALDEAHIFQDLEFQPIQMTPNGKPKRKIMKKKGKAGDYPTIYSCSTKSELQKLFDEFRFAGFNATLHELKERINATSSADRRRDMLLVLVSKSGGHQENIRALLQLARRLRNEPVHERAAVVRSLTKRACVWRLSQDVWDEMVEYALGLGLDGSEPEAECSEGLHAVVIRQLLSTGNCDKNIFNAFLENFSTLAEYKVTAKERKMILAGLQNILIARASDGEPEYRAQLLNKLLDVLDKYHASYDSVVTAIGLLAEHSLDEAIPLLMRLYDARVGRQQLFHQNLAFRHDDAALLNLLRHTPTIGTIEPRWVVQLLSDNEIQSHQFISKLSVYFNESGGIADQIKYELQRNLIKEFNAKLIRPLATLAGEDMMSFFLAEDMSEIEYKKLRAALCANMHLARPASDAFALGWRKTGVKAVASRVARCRPAEVTKYVNILVTDKKTLRLALMLAQRTYLVADTFSTAMTIRPNAVLRAALTYFRNVDVKPDDRIWDIVKSLILSVDLKSCLGIRHVLIKVEWIPKSIKPDYCAALYLALKKISDNYANHVLIDLMACLPEVSNDLLEKIVLLIMENMNTENPISYPAIAIRYLMLSETDIEQSKRFENTTKLILQTIQTFYDQQDTVHYRFYQKNLQQVLMALQYNTAYLSTKYPCCETVIRSILTWLQKFLPKETHFKEYVKIHATLLYCKAVRQSMKNRPGIFQDLNNHYLEGVDIVGFTFGRFIVKELQELQYKYFDSIIELYRREFSEYLSEYFVCVSSRANFIAAVIKGILLDRESKAGRFAIYIYRDFLYDFSEKTDMELKELIMANESKETRLFIHAEILA